VLATELGPSPIGSVGASVNPRQMATEPRSAPIQRSPVEAARRLAPAAGALADQIERDRALPAPLLASLIDAGLM
jgi:hypothetical protein